MEPGAGARPAFPIPNTWRRASAWPAAARRSSATADVILQVRSPGANPGDRRRRPGAVAAGPDRHRLRRTAHRRAMRRAPWRDRGVTFLAMELMPRITRAQSMDALSSMATIAGYKAVLIAADALPRMFPMLMTAAGTVAPARVLVIGAGVAGLAGHRHGAPAGRGGQRLRYPRRRQGADREPGRALRRAGRGSCRRRGQGRLRQGHGRGVLPPAARADGRRAGRAERGHHHRRRARQESADADHARDGGAHGAGLGDRRYRRRARRQLRTDAPRRNRG